MVKAINLLPNTQGAFLSPSCTIFLTAAFREGGGMKGAFLSTNLLFLLALEVHHTETDLVTGKTILTSGQPQLMLGSNKIKEVRKSHCYAAGHVNHLLLWKVSLSCLQAALTISVPSGLFHMVQIQLSAHQDLACCHSWCICRTLSAFPPPLPPPP